MPSSLINSDDCISCGACVSECPNNAISESSGTSEVDADKCDNCNGSPACQEICPVDCIKTIS